MSHPGRFYGGIIVTTQNSTTHGGPVASSGAGTVFEVYLGIFSIRFMLNPKFLCFIQERSGSRTRLNKEGDRTDLCPMPLEILIISRGYVVTTNTHASGFLTY